MGPKLKSILNNAWNEPRHFCFWLGLISFLGMAVLLSIQGLLTYETQKSAVGLMIGFLELGCLLAFVVAVPGFILAWIPPLRRLFAWLLARRFLVLGACVTLIALAYAIESWRGRSAWQNYKREHEAKGERFELSAYIPPPVPADQNFYETPLWQDLRFAHTNGSTIWEDPEHESNAVFTIYAPGNPAAPSGGTWMKGQHVDLAAWQGYYRGDSNQVTEAMAPSGEAEAFRRRYGLEGQPGSASASPATNYFPAARQPQTPAADVLLALSKFETNRQLLIETIGRPQARFWGNYDAGYAMLLPHLARLRAAALYMSLHATASLQAGDKKTALQDVMIAFELQEKLKREPALIAHLVRLAMLQIVLQPVWEGLANHQWSAEDLGRIEAELVRQNLLEDYEHAMRAERACNLWGVDYMNKAGLDGWSELAGGAANAESRNLDNCLGRALYRLTPSGWFDQNKLSISRNYERYILPAADPQRRLVLPDVTKEGQSALEGLKTRVYDIFSRLLMPAIANAVTRFSRTQASVDQALIACALERYRLDNGHYPEALEALVPKLLPVIPHDVVGGQPLKYRRTPDGQFVLYSVGWNGADDGGQVELKESGTVDLGKGDWAWRYPSQ